jgi:hypothetical protein
LYIAYNGLNNNLLIRFYILSVLICCIGNVFTYAQDSTAHDKINSSNVKDTVIYFNPSLLDKDTLIISPSSIGDVKIVGVPEAHYKLLPLQGKLVWEVKPLVDSIVVSFRKLYIDFNASYAIRHLSAVDSNIPLGVHI